MSTVVVLHGFTGDGDTMASIVDRLPGRVEAPDLPGHGRGPHPTDPDRYSVDAMARSVVGDRRDPVHLVGYSMGGRVALTAACRFPDKVRSLSLIGASAGIVDPVERAARAAADDALADTIEGDLAAFVDRWMANPLFATQRRLGPSFLASARAQRLRNDPVALAASLRANSTGRMHALHDALPSCRVPTAVIAGADDPKFVAIAHDLVARLPDATVHVVERAGHAVHLEQPEAVVDAIVATIIRAP